MKIVPGFENWSELDLLTGCIVGEASGEPTDGQVAVALVIRTRVEHPRWWGRNWREVILADKQFSCWQDHNAYRIIQARHSRTPAWTKAALIAHDVYIGLTQDFLDRATHYHAHDITPKWAGKMTRLDRIGDHVFYRDEGELR